MIPLTTPQIPSVARSLSPTGIRPLILLLNCCLTAKWRPPRRDGEPEYRTIASTTLPPDRRSSSAIARSSSTTSEFSRGGARPRYLRSGCRYGEQVLSSVVLYTLTAPRTLHYQRVDVEFVDAIRWDGTAMATCVMEMFYKPVGRNPCPKEMTMKILSSGRVILCTLHAGFNRQEKHNT